MKKSRCLQWPLHLTLLLSVGFFGCTTAIARPATDSDTSITESEEPTQTNASNIRMRENHPSQYTVKKGDSLWKISSIFLKDPWFWPEIWQKNPQLENPHLIFPGDVLTLVIVNGQPKILVNVDQAKTVESTSKVTPKAPPKVVLKKSLKDRPLRVVKASPKVRRDELAASIPVIPGDAIRQFVIKPRVVPKAELDKAPYIVSSDAERLILSQGDRIYVRGELDKERVRYTVFRPNQELIDPDSKELLGYEAVYAGEAHIETYGNPAVGSLTFTEREVLIGDRLLPIDKASQNNLFLPHVPKEKVTARIVSLFDALFGAAKYQVAVINQGSRDGIEVGHVLASYIKGAEVRDRYHREDTPEKLVLPDERSGLLMIFRTFDQVSYALIMESTNVIRSGDTVRTPD